MSGIHKRLAEAAGRMPSLGKDERNTAQGFAYRSIEAIVAAAKPVLSELGISIVPRVVSHQTETIDRGTGKNPGYRVIVEVEYLVGCNAEEDGSGEHYELVGSMMGEAIDYGDKATSKAVQMAFKYFLTDLLLVASDDNDESSAAPAAPAKKRKPGPVAQLKIDLVKIHGKDPAAAAWKILFADGPPKAEELVAKRVEEIKLAIAGIVEDSDAVESPGEGYDS